MISYVHWGASSIFSAFDVPCFSSIRIILRREVFCAFETVRCTMVHGQDAAEAQKEASSNAALRSIV